jgi:hypothetical protein
MKVDVERCSSWYMHDPIKDPDYWRERAEKTRLKANRYPGERERILRIAEEYDKLAERAAERQHNARSVPLKE